MRLKLKDDGGDHHDEVEFSVGATRMELYVVVSAVVAGIGWLCRHGFFG